MKPLYVLLGAFVLLLFAGYAWTGDWPWKLAGNIAIAVMLCFTALGHFMFTRGMALMLPPIVPFRKAVVLATGVIEILLAIGLCIPAVRETTGVATIVFLGLLLPANIYAAFRHLDYEKATYTGKGPAYLRVRIPLQCFFIAWVWVFTMLRTC